MNIQLYIELSSSLYALFGPLIEVVIHETKTNKIAHIIGNLSNRKVGDDSLLDELTSSDLNQAYTKLSYNGHIIRSISIPIREANKIIGLMCINVDTTIFHEIHALTSTLLEVNKKPESLFKNDWQDRINTFIATYIKENNINYENLSNKHKKNIIYALYNNGAFQEKKSADYIAHVMHLSRATIFNYLRTWRK